MDPAMELEKQPFKVYRAKKKDGNRRNLSFDKPVNQGHLPPPRHMKQRQHKVDGFGCDVGEGGRVRIVDKVAEERAKVEARRKGRCSAVSRGRLIKGEKSVKIFNDVQDLMKRRRGRDQEAPQELYRSDAAFTVTAPLQDRDTSSADMPYEDEVPADFIKFLKENKELREQYRVETVEGNDAVEELEKEERKTAAEASRVSEPQPSRKTTVEPEELPYKSPSVHSVLQQALPERQTHGQYQNQTQGQFQNQTQGQYQNQTPQYQQSQAPVQQQPQYQQNQYQDQSYYYNNNNTGYQNPQYQYQYQDPSVSQYQTCYEYPVDQSFYQYRPTPVLSSLEPSFYQDQWSQGAQAMSSGYWNSGYDAAAANAATQIVGPNLRQEKSTSAVDYVFAMGLLVLFIGVWGVAISNHPSMHGLKMWILENVPFWELMPVTPRQYEYSHAPYMHGRPATANMAAAPPTGYHGTLHHK